MRAAQVCSRQVVILDSNFTGFAIQTEDFEQHPDQSRGCQSGHHEPGPAVTERPERDPTDDGDRNQPKGDQPDPGERVPGLIDRFGSPQTTDTGETDRYSLQLNWQKKD